MAKTKKDSPISFEKFYSERETPHAKDIERAILGAILLEESAVERVFKFIKEPKVFYEEPHQIVFTAIQYLKFQNLPIDTITVVDHLRKTDQLKAVGDAVFVSELGSEVSNSANVEYHCLLLFQYFLRRTLANYAMNLYDVSTDMLKDELKSFDDAILDLDKLKSQVVSMKEIEFSMQVEITMKEIVDEMNGRITQVNSGFKNVDYLTGGRVRGESSIIAARTSMGKTTRMIKEVLNVALTENKKVGIISLETKSNQLIRKMLSNMARVDSSLFRSKNLQLKDIDNLHQAKDILKDYNVWIHDMAGINITDVKAIARRWKAQFNVDIIYIDYMTLIKQQNPYTKNQNDEVTKISQGIKELAMDLNIPMVTLAQINRSPEARPDKRPNMSDLRDSGSIEQDADVISLLYRPEYYGELEDADGNDLRGIMEEAIKKNRNGLTGTVYHRFIPAIGEFEPVYFKDKKGNPTAPHPTDSEPDKFIEPTYEREPQPF